MKNFRQTQRLATLAVAGLMLFSCSNDDDTNPIDDDPIVELPPIVLDCDYFSEDRVLTDDPQRDRKSTRLNSSHVRISYAVFCLKKKNQKKVCVFGLLLQQQIVVLQQEV